MKFSQKVGSLFIGGLLLSTNLFACTDSTSEGEPAYGPTAYKTFFDGIKGLENRNDLKTAVTTFIKTNQENLTLTDFYSHLQTAHKAGDVSLDHLTAINVIVGDWALRTKRKREKTFAPEDFNLELIKELYGSKPNSSLPLNSHPDTSNLRLKIPMNDR
ncbi:hypothetical protein [Candidatus Finniella inopinata]|uniref:Uncharacterized protein n=1 Tax=Candidatus Finniella inopinata TaxID=1696036 RepID=A0A4Q7DGA5_9PROT|nr:hypothetical protein [Candidatus Finniella inopinata]RZI45218.1 hypothetical protein EQU50_08015 [Candidatus Finniella inopinata]